MCALLVPAMRGPVRADCRRLCRAYPGASTAISLEEVDLNLEASDGKSRTPTHARR